MASILTKLFSVLPKNTPEYRMCWVHGKKAIFHRWVDTARVVKPRGMEETETTDRYQLHHVHGLVEFEDGSLARVWPQDIQFVDTRPEFEENDWGLPYTDDDNPGDENEATTC